jgi:hypothetical protein
MRLEVLDIPGYAGAVLHERLVRDAAFLGLPETVAGFELRQLTLRDYVLLRAKRMLLLSGGVPEARELAVFLWLMSTGYCLDERVRKRFFQRCRFFQPPAMPLLRTNRAMARWQKRRFAAIQAMGIVLAAVWQYLEETFQDRPPGGASGPYYPSYYSDASYWCAMLGREHHQSYADTLDLPLKVLWQAVKEIKDHSGKNLAGLSNPSDKVVVAWCAHPRN